MRFHTLPVESFNQSPSWVTCTWTRFPLWDRTSTVGPSSRQTRDCPEGFQHLGDYLSEVHGAAWGWGVPISSSSSRMTTRSSKGRFSPWISW